MMPTESKTDKQLEWIKDGMEWLVGFAAGALVLSGTYFVDTFKQNPTIAWPLVTAWAFLLVTVLSGTLCFFSAWKNLGADTKSGWGDWFRISYGICMWTFLIGYLFLAVSLVVNLLTLPAPGPPANPAVFR